jgi:cytosine/creatinine deaminase
VNLLVRNVRPLGGAAVDLLACDGTWATDGRVDIEIDGRGMLALPGFVDGHMHLDKTLLGLPWRPHVPGGSVRERVAAEKAIYATLPPDSMAERARRLADLALSHGTTVIRTHVDVDPSNGLSGLHTLLALRTEYADRLTMQIVAFPQSGVITCPGTAELLEQAVCEGADLVGGLDPIGFDADLDGQLDVVFGIAVRHGVGVDIHLHDPGEIAARTLFEVAKRTVAGGLQGRVNVSHAYGMGDLDTDRLQVVCEALAEAGVSIMSNAPGRGSFPPIDALLERGVSVFSGSDNIRDPWWPFGDADQLERAMLVAYRMDWRTDEWLAEALQLVTHRAASALGLTRYGLGVPGAPADLVLVDAETVAEAVVARPRRALAVAHGRVIGEGEDRRTSGR